MNSYLITGGAGYIGSHLAFSLAQSGYFVRVLDNFCRAPKENVTALLAPYAKRVEIVEGDVRNLSDCAGAMKDVTHVIHLAGLGSVGESIQKPAEHMDVNVTGTATVLTAALSAGQIARVVVGSSCAVYGESTAMSKLESSFAEPITPYGVSKLAAENIAKSFHKLHDLPAVCLRFFNTYGPVDDPHDIPVGFLASLVCASSRGETAILYGNGEQTRDFIYIDDTIQACIAAGNAPRHIACGHVFNVGAGRRVSLNEAIEAIEKQIGRTLIIDRQALRAGDIRHSRAEITKAAGMLQFTAAVRLEEGLARLIASYQEGGINKQAFPDFTQNNLPADTLASRLSQASSAAGQAKAA